MTSDHQKIRQHFINHLDGHDVSEFKWQPGPMKEIAPSFHVLRFAPGPKYELWTYVSVGASSLGSPKSKLEFAIFSSYESPRFVELITMSAHYQLRQMLSVGDTVPLGEPWVPNSSCASYMLSLPYPLGPEFEICEVDDGHVHTLWLLPITEKEHRYKVENGVEELEAAFDEKEIEYWDFDRQSAI
jgi:hypothetical protein